MIFEVNKVSVEMGGRKVLEDLNFTVDQGENVVIVGVNGSGKTTLLKLLDGLIYPTQGKVWFEGQPLDAKSLDNPELRREFRSKVAILFQNVDAMLFNPTVADEIAFSPRQLGLSDPKVDARVLRWAEIFKLTQLLGRTPFELSGGEKKRVALAAVMALEPRILLLDEATAGLDPAMVAQLIDLLESMTQMTIISSTHSLTYLAHFGKRALLLSPMHKGLLFDGSIVDLLADERLMHTSGLIFKRAT